MSDKKAGEAGSGINLDALARNREILYEVRAVGNAVRVAAIDADTGVEAVIVGSRVVHLYSLKANARRKLIRTLLNEGVFEKRDPWAGL